MIYLTTDIHGKTDSLKRLLEAANFGDEDFLFILGDVIDRNGDGGVSLLIWLLTQPNVQLILGNHEYTFLLGNKWLFDEINDSNIDEFNYYKLSNLYNWQHNGGDVTIEAMRKISAETRADIITYLEECPLHETITVNDRRYILTHSGLGCFGKDKPLDDYIPHDLLWSRPMQNTVYNPEEYTVIIGHTPTLCYGSEFRNRIMKTESFWNIDTGAATKDGQPMLLCLDTLREYYIEPNGEIITIDP